jgi:hypothetical protein
VLTLCTPCFSVVHTNESKLKTCVRVPPPLLAGGLRRGHMQATVADFALEPIGHKFKLRNPLSKVGARKCSECGEDFAVHGRSEVSDEDFLAVLNVVDENATVIVPGELALGGFKAALRACSTDSQCVCINAAGSALHDFLPNTRAPFNKLRSEGRVFDLEWYDSEDFELPLSDLLAAISWANQHVRAGKLVVMNCAQGRSRSGACATAYLMATRDLNVDDALATIRAKRPFVQPNAGFMKALRQHEVPIRNAMR